MEAENAGVGRSSRYRLAFVSWPVLVVLVALVVGVRSYERVVYPTMQVEDGARIYAYFHDHRGFGHVFRFKSGYMPLLPNVLGYVSVRLPPPAAPYFMALAPTLFSVFAYTSFFFRRFRAVVADDGLRFLTCLALALAPVGQFFLVSHTDFSIWNALFCAVLWAWAPLPDGPWRAGSSLAAQQLFVWSHPISIVAAPINAAQVWFAKSRGQRITQGAMLVGHALHLALGLDHSFTQRTVGARIGDFPRRLVEYEHRALARALFGRRSLVWLETHGGAWLVLAATLALLAGALWVALRDPRLRLSVVLAAYSLTGLAVAVAASRTGRQIDHGIRYIYVQSLFAAMLIVFVVRGAWQAARWPARLALRRRRLAQFAPDAVLVALFALQNVSVGRFRANDGGHNAARVADCMRRLAAHQAERGGPCGFSLTCTKSDDWNIVFRPPKCRR